MAAVLGVAAVVCVTAAVAGEMLQDLKVGHILGGTPWKMQLGDMMGVLVAAAVMFIPLVILHQGDIAMGGTGLGGQSLPGAAGQPDGHPRQGHRRRTTWPGRSSSSAC